MKTQEQSAIYRGFGAAVKSGRKKQGITQKQLAKTIGMSHVWVCEVEKGVQRVTLGDAVSLCSILNLSVRTVLQGVNNEQG